MFNLIFRHYGDEKEIFFWFLLLSSISIIRHLIQNKNQKVKIKITSHSFLLHTLFFLHTTMLIVNYNSFHQNMKYNGV